jgi:hypothetical protein
VATLVQDPTLAVYASILISYHVFLAWLMFGSSNKPVGSLPIFHTVLTHMACMVVVLGPVLVARHATPVFGVFRYGIAALALFERGWLHTAAGTAKRKPKEEAAPVAAQVAVGAPKIYPTPEDQAAWREYLARRGPGMMRAGLTMQVEYEQWLRARHKARSKAANKSSVAR